MMMLYKVINTPATKHIDRLLDAVRSPIAPPLSKTEQHIKDFEFAMFLNDTANDVKFWFDVHFPNKDSVYEGVG